MKTYRGQPEDVDWWKHQCIVLWMKHHGYYREPVVPPDKLVIPSDSVLFEWLYNIAAVAKEGMK